MASFARDGSEQAKGGRLLYREGVALRYSSEPYEEFLGFFVSSNSQKRLSDLYRSASFPVRVPGVAR